jgi:cysteine desulfuration protein SufE
MALPAKLQAVLDTFAMFPDQADRTNMLLSYANKYRDVSPEIATKPYGRDHLVPHCESEAYVWAVSQNDGTLRLAFAVENPSGVSAKALAAILEQTLSGLRPQQIEQVTPDIVEQIFRQNISMGKGMGLMSMVQAVRVLARRASERAHAAE